MNKLPARSYDEKTEARNNSSERIAWLCFFATNALWICVVTVVYLNSTPVESDGIKLHTAIAYNDLTTFEELLSNGVSPDTPGRNGYPPIITAIEHGDITITTMLLDAGADVNASVPGRGTNDRALQIALSVDIKLAELLINYGADINGRNRDGSTPLHHAVVYDTNGDFINLLVDNGAEVNAPNTDNDTPLHWAASQDSYEAAKHLINRGADKSIRNTLGLAPVDLAKKGRPDIKNWGQLIVDDELVLLLEESAK